jgi:hypothetical protein
MKDTRDCKASMKGKERANEASPAKENISRLEW